MTIYWSFWTLYTLLDNVLHMCCCKWKTVSTVAWNHPLNSGIIMAQAPDGDNDEVSYYWNSQQLTSKPVTDKDFHTTVTDKNNENHVFFHSLLNFAMEHTTEHSLFWWGRNHHRACEKVSWVVVKKNWVEIRMVECRDRLKPNNSPVLHQFLVVWLRLFSIMCRISIRLSYL